MKTTVKTANEFEPDEVHSGCYAQPFPTADGVALSIVAEEDDSISDEYDPGTWVSFETTAD